MKRQQRVTREDVARKANVAASTVSLALYDRPNIGAATKARIRRICRELGYQTPGMRGNGPRTSSTEPVQRLGFFLVSSNPQADSNLTMIHSLTRYTHARDIRLEILSTDEATGSDMILERAIAFARPLDGLLLTGIVDEQLLAGLAQANIPTVVAGHVHSPADRPVSVAHNVEVDSVAMGHLAAATLLARGHRRIAFACDRMPPGFWNARWLTGYRLAHLEAGVPMDDRLVYIEDAAGADGASPPAAVRTLSALPTAYVLPSVYYRLPALLLQHSAGLPRQAIVYGATEQLIGQSFLAESQVLSENTDLLAAVAVQHLREICVEPTPCPVRMIVPFGVHNLALPGTAP